jgi:hypothetical protein
MTIRQIGWFFFSLIIYSNSSFAFFCPTNFNLIEMGNTKQQIDSICGKPKQVREKEKIPEVATPQEWSYFVQKHIVLETSHPGSTKVTMAFDEKGKLMNMTVNGINRSATNFCGGSILYIGDSRDTVKKACGNPVYVNKPPSATQNQPKPIKVTEYQYDTTPPVTLIFENDVLVEKR